MSELFKKFKWATILFGSLLIVAGILVFVVAIVNPGIISLILSIIVAACLFIAGLVMVTTSFINEPTKVYTPALGYASLLIALGVLLCVDTSVLSNLAILFMGIVLIVVGALALVRMVLAIVWRAKAKVIVFLVLIAALCIAGGVLILVYQAVTIMFTIVYICAGAALAVIGVIQLIVGIKLLSKNE